MRGEFNPSFFMWFPSFKAWVCAILSALLLAPLGILFRMVSESLFNLLELQTRTEDWRLWLFLAIAVLIFPTFLWGHVHQFFWGEPNPKFPRW